MAWYFRASLTMNVLLLLLTVVSIPHANCCYTSIIGFGDSLVDTGNTYINALDHHKGPYHFFFPPYGETYFHHPTGRCCDGRLIIDFIAESMGLPLVRPYFEVLNVSETVRNFEEGVNFAVVGAGALDTDFLDPLGHYNTAGISFQVLLFLWDRLEATITPMRFFSGDSLEIVERYVPFVIEAMASAINELIQHGASTLWVPGNVPIGCLPVYLTHYEGSDESEYDPSTGCLTWLNKFSEYHNELLQIKLSRIRSLHPHVNIIYGDVYTAILQLYQSPEQFGFTGNTTIACCGGGGTYNYNSSAECGLPAASACANPAKSINWDGRHCTEAANRWMAKALLNGIYTIPHISTSCVSQL